MKKYFLLFNIILIPMLISCFVPEVKIPTKKKQIENSLCNQELYIPDNLYIFNTNSNNMLISKEHMIWFEFGSNKLKKNDYKTIEDIYLFMQTNKNIKMIIEGHADYLGSNADERNYPLSMERGTNIFSELTNLGIDTNRLYIFGYSDSTPKYEGTNKYRDRRVEFVIIKCDAEFEAYTNRYNQINITNNNVLE